MKREWDPVPWSHHPQTVKDTIRQAGFRPRAKRCFDNCGQFVMALRYTELAERFRYCEGFVQSCGVPIEHAWLLHDDRIVDLTLAEGRSLQYDAKLTLTVEQACTRIVELNRYGPLLNVEERNASLVELQRWLQQNNMNGMGA